MTKKERLQRALDHRLRLLTVLRRSGHCMSPVTEKRLRYSIDQLDRLINTLQDA